MEGPLLFFGRVRFLARPADVYTTRSRLAKTTTLKFAEYQLERLLYVIGHFNKNVSLLRLADKVAQYQ